MITPEVMCAFKNTSANLPIPQQNTLPRLLKIFECYLHTTNQNLDLQKLRNGKKFSKLIHCFIGALLSEKIIEGKEANSKLLLCLIYLLNDIIETDPEVNNKDLKETILLHKRTRYNKLNKYAQYDKENQYDQISIEYWEGWPVEDKHGAIRHLNLNNLWLSHGPEFTRKFHDTFKSPLLSIYSSFQIIDSTNKLSIFLAQTYPKYGNDPLNDEYMIKNLFIDFCREWFVNTSNIHNVENNGRYWNKFIHFIESRIVSSGAWKSPYNGFPLPKISQPKANNTHITKTAEGIDLKKKLITSVPLHIKDIECIEEIFIQINNDVSIVHNWAEYLADDLYRRSTNRKKLAKTGISIESKCDTPLNSIPKENICTTFQKHGYNIDRNHLTFYYGIYSKKIKLKENSLKSLNKIIAIPTAYSLDCFMFLLIYECPIITADFLNSYFLYDKNGRKSGYIKFDNTWVLKGNKNRRGQNLSEQKIILNNKAKSYIDKIIEITEPLRIYLKKNKNDNWRKLFITVNGKYVKPTTSGNMRHSSRKNGSPTPCVLNRLEEFKAAAKRLNLYIDNDEGISNIFYSTTLSSLRAQRGVQIYLKTASVEETRIALGHAKYNPELLRHYLPESILEYFQERWIRLFQKGIICEAMKDSPLLQTATNFCSEDELFEFLSNHALKDMPEYLKNPEHLDIPESKLASPLSSIYISINSTILIELIKLIKKVDNNKKHNASSKAEYWYILGKKIISYIKNSNDRLLIKHLNIALEATKAEAL